MAKKKDNYLDYIPRPNTLFECNKNKDGKIEIKMHNNIVGITASTKHSAYWRR